MISIGIDPGKRMGAVMVDNQGRVCMDYLNQDDFGAFFDVPIIASWQDPTDCDLGDFFAKFYSIEDKDCDTPTVWIEEPDHHVMAGRIGMRQTHSGPRQSVYHRTNVHAIFSLGVAAGRIVLVSEQFGFPYHFITAGEVKRLVTGDASISKAHMALYLESLGYSFPRLPSGQPDPECVDALAIALAGLKKEER